tara:strand:+ start:61 stop:264 length:204 start_codon:yes stop_codon:yes gene_type:complete
MEKTIVVIRRCKYGSLEPKYNVEKSAQSLEKAMQYKVALETLNTEKEVTYSLMNELGQMEYNEKEVA